MVFLQIVASLARLLMSIDGKAKLPTERAFGGCVDPLSVLAIEEPGRRSQWLLPGQLRQRQRLLGNVAQRLRNPAPSGLAPWPAASVRKLATSWAPHWPAAALDWICPQAAQVVLQKEALRQTLGVSPRYFKACSALFASLR